ncbi:ribonuclease Z [Paenibacillus turpanensis]|uniref:ribonuclease Z n=1 Tax=Paenibacillus turpanensis TaxID=2689078 RepID=UPI00140D7074
MDLYFLGTGAGIPSTQRNVTSIVLRLLDERGTIWMFDCGEGTQQQVLASPIKLGKLEKLFITHLHGDHLYGLPGALTSRSYQGGDTPLTVYGPQGLRRFVETALEVSGAHLSYDLHIEELQSPGLVFEDEQFAVYADELDHRIVCYGYRVEQKPLPGPLLSDKLKADGVKPGPVYAQLKQGRDVTLPDGRVLASSDYVGQPVPGRIVTVLGDTRPCEAAVRLARDCSVLVHEATFAEQHRELAHQYYHATAGDAARAAAEAGAKALVLTHISSRYQGDAADMLLAEAQLHFAETKLASDLWSCTIP